jgi:hypothetical protein
MHRGLVGTLLAATTLSALLTVAPSAAQAAAVPTASVQPVAAVAAARHLISYKITFGRCKDTCRINVKIKNISRQTIYQVTLNASLKINGHKSGTCFDSVGTIRAKHSRSAGCTVRTRTLSTLWNRYLDGGMDWNSRASTNVHYLYYR